MNVKQLALAAIVGGSLIAAGCDDKTPAPAATPAATGADASMSPTMKNAQDQAKATVDAVQAKSADATPSMAKDAADNAPAAGDSMVAQAQKLYDGAKSSMNKADFAGAQKYVDQLTALSGKLPPEWQLKIAELAKMVSDGKSKLGGMSMPAMPK